MFVLFQNLYIETLTPDAMVLGSGAFGRQFGHKGGVSMNGISAFLRRDI